MSLEDIIHNLDLRNVKTTTGSTFAEELTSAANLLRDCIQSRINRGTMGNVLTTADIADVQVNGMTLTVDLKVQNSMRPSIFKPYNGMDANVFWLLNDGFEVKKKWVFAGFKHPERWTTRIAEKFVEEGIADFESRNRLGIKVQQVKRPLLYYG